MDGLFEKMLEDVDEVHKESLSFYLRTQMMFSRDRPPGGGPSIVLLTASRGHSPIDYHRFIEMCEQTEKQIVAQSRGLLEIHEAYGYPFLRKGLEISRQSKSSEVSRQLYSCVVPWHTSDRISKMSLQTPSDRQKSFSSRHLVTSNEQVGRLLVLEAFTVQWVHRCAYDFMLLHTTDRICILLDKISDVDVAQRLADASIKLFVASPWSGYFDKMGFFLNDSSLNRISESMYQSFCRCYNVLYISMHYAKDSASASLAELEALMDQLDVEALPDFRTLSRPPTQFPSSDHREGLMNWQYTKDMVKAFMWNSGLSLGFFDFVSAGLPRIAKYKYGAAILSNLIRLVPLGQTIEKSIAFERDMLRTLRHIYLGEKAL